MALQRPLGRRVPARRAAFAAPMLVSLLCLTGCASPPHAGPWRLDWGVTVREQIIGNEASGVFALPIDFEGEESWWVSGDELVIESRGSGADGARGARRLWLDMRTDWVYTQEPGAPLRRTARRRWEEERRRGQRAAMVDALRSDALAALGPQKRYFLATHELRRHEAGYTRRWWTLSPLPGRLMRLSGSCGRHAFWRSTLLPLAFEGTTPEQCGFLAEALGRAGAAVVEEVTVPSGGESTVLRRELDRVTNLDDTSRFPAHPAAEAAAIEDAEREWRSFDVLWSYLVDSERRPAGLDAREARVRLEPLMSADKLPLVRERAAAASDLEALEELLHLEYAADPPGFLQATHAAQSAGDLPQLVARISVLSLRAPREARRWVADLLAADEALWNDMEDAERVDTLEWLAGVKAWLESISFAAVASEPPRAP